MRNKAAKPGGVGTATGRRSRRPVETARTTIAVLVYEGVSSFELGVACGVFGDDAWVEPGQPWYRLLICGPDRTAVRTDGGLRIEAPYGLDHVAEAGTVVALPTSQWDHLPEPVLDTLRNAHRRGARLVSFCTGAFVLAAAGLLEGRRVTTHWAESADLERRFTGTTVDPGVLYVDDGDVLTSAGSAASLDLSLHLVRCDFGSEMATRCARQMVVPPQRAGGQAQFIESPLPKAQESDLFVATMNWMEGHLDGEVTVEDLARRSAMSPRTFARRFVAATGTTPYQWLVRQRVQLAQRLLESSDLSVEQVAAESGFGSAANLRKHFGRVVRTSPYSYRSAFRDRAAT
jgi:AraC family transcriptional regulator, transcriptional activator FtrA